MKAKRFSGAGRGVSIRWGIMALAGFFLSMVLGVLLDTSFVYGKTTPEEDGRTVSAVISARYHNSTMSQYTVEFQYFVTIGTGKIVGYVGTEHLDEQTYRALKLGRGVKVKYPFGNPGAAHITSLAQTSASVRLPVFAIVLPCLVIVSTWLLARYYPVRWIMLGCVWILVFLWHVSYSETAIQRQTGPGVYVPVADATILELRESGDKYQVTYRLTLTQAGGARNSHVFTSEISGSQYRRAVVGSMIRVRYYVSGPDWWAEPVTEDSFDIIDVLHMRLSYCGLIGIFMVLTFLFVIVDADDRAKWALRRRQKSHKSQL